MNEKIQLTWKVNKLSLSSDQKAYILRELNRLATKYPNGFDISFDIDEYSKEMVIKFIEEEINCVVKEVGFDFDSYTLAIYQTNEDMVTREAQR